MKRFYFVLLLFIIPVLSYAQTPGGVGSTNINLWLSGDSNVTDSGTLNWGDLSGVGDDAYQGTEAFKPTQSNYFNFNETFTFDGTEDYLAIENLNYTANQLIDNLYGFVVYSSEFSGGTNDNHAFIGFGRSNAYAMSIRGNGRLGFMFRDVDNNNNETLQTPSGSNVNDGTQHIGTFMFETSNLTDTQIRSDGRLEAASDKLDNELKIRSNRYGFIGDDSSTASENGSNAGNYYEGDIAEIILYNQASTMGATDIAKIETHLALKYGITLDASDGGTAGDYIDSGGNTIWDASANSDYHHGVGGIIHDHTVGAVHQKIANPLGSYLTITTGITGGTVSDFTSENSNASRTAVTTDTYLMFGDNGASLGFDESAVTGKIILNRRWLFKESGTETNNVFLAVSEDLFPSGATVQVIVSSNDTFDNSDTVYSLTNSGGLYATTTAIDIDDNDRVTFLIDDDIKIAGVSIGKIDLVIKADESTLVGDVFTLQDVSYGLTNAVQDVVANTPGTSGLMNFNPTLTFDGTDDYLYLKNKFYTIDDEIPNLHIFTVFNTDFNDGGTRTNSSFVDFDRNGIYSQYIRGDGKLSIQLRSEASGKTETGTAVLNDGLPHIAEAIFDGTAVGDDTFVKYDGIVDDSSEKLAGNIIVTDKTRYGIIGDESNDDIENGTTRGVHYDGQISEIILTDNAALTSNEIIQIESYLALKYGITLDSSITNYLNSSGATLWNNTSYWNGIAGIIKDHDDSDLDQRIAQSTSAQDLILATLSIAAPATPNFTTTNLDTDRTSLNEGSYLLFGNNGAVAGALEENVALSKSVTTRHWLFKEAGTNLDDLVHVAIPKSYFPEDATAVVAYIGSDDTFDGSDTSVALTDDGTYYYFTRDIDDGDVLAYGATLPTFTGPGNVTDGLTMWIKSDENVTSSGEFVSAVVDATFSGNNLLQNDISDRPTIEFNNTNYNPSISFDRQRLAIESLNYNGIGAIEKVYAWVIYKTSFYDENTGSGVDDKNNGFIDFDRRKYFNMHVRGDGKLSMSYRNSINSGAASTNAIGATVTNTGITQLGGFIFDNSLGDESILRLNGDVDFESDLSDHPIGTNSGSVTRFGYVGDGSNAATFDGNSRGDHYEGAISEIVYYEGETLSADEINRVESYLAIKYGVSLTGDYVDSATPTANTIWDATTNAGYTNDVAVIGRDDDSGLEQKQSKSESSDGVLTISIDTAIATSNEDNSGTFDDDLDFLAWGNNSTDEHFVVDCSATDLKVNKTWKVQNTGSVGNVTMQFDMSNIPDPSSFELLIDVDGDFTTTGDQTTETGTLTGTNLTFTTVLLNDGVYFSLFKSAASDIVYNGSWSGGSGTGGTPDNTDLGKRVTIENSVTLSESFNCNCLKINTGQVITVPTDEYISANEIILDGDIYLEGTAELVQTDDHTSNSGSGKLYKIIGEATDSPYRFNFFSAPVNTSGSFTLASNFKFNTGGTLADNTDPSFIDNDSDGFGTTISSNWIYTLNNGSDFVSANENTALSPGVGFTMKGTGVANDYNFIGTPNNGEINLPLDDENYLLTGNPYPSTINIDTFNANMLAEDVTDGSVYLWDQPTGDTHQQSQYNGGYATIINGVKVAAATENDVAVTGATTPTEFIKPGQGFIVNGTSNDASVQFTNVLRNGIDYALEASTAHFYKVQKPSVLKSVIYLGFEYKNENDKIYHRQLATVLENENLLEREVGKDAYMFDDFENDAYWVLPNQEERFVITGVPTLLYEDDLELPIGVVLNKGREITFKLDNLENVNDNVYLFDRDKNTLIHIENNEYVTWVASGVNTQRFSLVFNKEETLALDSLEGKDKMTISVGQNHMNIMVKNEVIEQVKLYDFTGNELLSHQNTVKKSEIIISTKDINTQLIIAKVITSHNTLTKKVVLKHIY